MLVVCDDMNLPVGKLRLRAAKDRPAEQKGLKHILECLATEDVPRLRIGIGRPPGQMNAADFVLSRFRKDEAAVKEEAILKAADGVEDLDPPGKSTPAMNQFNGGDVESS